MADGERNFLPIVAIVIAVVFAAALTAGAVVWRRQTIADARAPSSPPPPPATAIPTATAIESPDPSDIRALPTDPATPDPSAIPNATAAIARLRPGFRSCYNKGLAADPNLQGKITIAITVAPNGDVTNATKKSGGLNADVDACMLRRAKSATFDPSPSGGTITVPVQFMRAN